MILMIFKIFSYFFILKGFFLEMNDKYKGKLLSYHYHIGLDVHIINFRHSLVISNILI